MDDQFFFELVAKSITGHIANFLRVVSNPQLKYLKYFEVLRDFRKGGLTPVIYGNFIKDIHQVIYHRYLPAMLTLVTKKYGLTDITQRDYKDVFIELKKRAKDSSKTCWHPEASMATCSLNEKGEVQVSAAHSIQNNGILKTISEDHHVMSYEHLEGSLGGKLVPKRSASTYYCFCNNHDAIFKPIEIDQYTSTDEQHFLYAYRAYISAIHAKVEVSYFMDFGDQAIQDIHQNLKLFHEALLKTEYSIIQTIPLFLPRRYPVAVSSSFDLEYDFMGKLIPHSTTRMEPLFVTLFPRANDTVILVSCFKQDEKLYLKLFDQLRNSKDLSSDLSIIVAAHAENIFFQPSYFRQYIDAQTKNIHTASREAGTMTIEWDSKLGDFVEKSLTSPTFLQNKLGINLFKH